MPLNNANVQQIQYNSIELCAQKENSSMYECFSHLLKFFQTWIEYKLALHETGLSTKSHISYNRKQPNDGRPSDCTSKLLGRRE